MAEALMIAVIGLVILSLTLRCREVSRILLERYKELCGPLDRREPPEVHPKIPIIGHALGFILNGNKYMVNLCKQTPHEIFTIRTPYSKVYIPKSAHLISEIQRRPGAFSFDVPKAKVVDRMFGWDVQHLILAGHDPKSKDRHTSLLTDTDYIHRTCLAGEALDKLTIDQWRDTAQSLNEMPKTYETELAAWSRRVVGMGNMRALYGKRNIMDLEPSLFQDFFTFEASMFWITVIGKLAWLVAPCAVAARKRILDALEKWMAAGFDEDAAAIVRERKPAHIKRGFSVKQTAHAEIGLMFAVMGNALPTSFWVLCKIFSDEGLLAAVRKELEDAKVVRSDGPRRIIDSARLKTASPLIGSVQRELLRHYGGNVTHRIVNEDTVIADRYLLKQGAMVQVFGDVIHEDRAVWGANAGGFDPYRFMDSHNGAIVTETGDAKTTAHPAAFRSFGGGKHLCPGRFFAANEILGFVALVVMGWEIADPAGGRIEAPEPERARVPFGVLKPSRGVRAVLKRRAGMEDAVWEFE